MVGVGVRVPLIALAGLGGSGEFERKFEEILGKLRNFERNEVSLGGSLTINSNLVGLVGFKMQASLVLVQKNT